jgi:hypothetical protein
VPAFQLASLVVQCPSAKVVLGGGAWFESLLMGGYPTPTNSGFVVDVKNEYAFASDVLVWVVCVNA